LALLIEIAAGEMLLVVVFLLSTFLLSVIVVEVISVLSLLLLVGILFSSNIIKSRIYICMISIIISDGTKRLDALYLLGCGSILQSE